jgi:hypothetical protein
MTQYEIPGFSRYYITKQMDDPEYGRPKVIGWTVWDRKYLSKDGVPQRGSGAVAALKRTKRESIAWVNEWGTPD